MKNPKRSNVKAPKARVLLVDDHPILRDGLARLINQTLDLEVSGQAADAQEALRLASSSTSHLMLVDLTLQDMSGLELIKNVRIRFPRLRILVLSMHKEALYAERALHAGANGYLMKQESPETVLCAIRKVLKGEMYLSEAMSSRAVSEWAQGNRDLLASPIKLLSDRELEVFELLGRGRGTRQIAEMLHLSIKTVETYREHIKAKLQLDNAAELAQHAFEWVKNESAN